MVYRDEDSILDQIYEKYIILAFFYEDYFFLRVIEENAYLRKYSTPHWVLVLFQCYFKKNIF